MTKGDALSFPSWLWLPADSGRHGSQVRLAGVGQWRGSTAGSDQRSRADHPFTFRKALELPQSSEPLAVQFIEALGHLLGLLESLTALLPARGHLLLPVIGAGDGPRHGGNGVRVPPQGDAVDDGSLQGVVVVRNVSISVHAAQEGVDSSGDGAQCSDAIAWNTACQHPLGFLLCPLLLQLAVASDFPQQ